MGSYLKRTPEGKYAWNHRSQTVGDQQKNTRSPVSDRRWRAVSGWSMIFLKHMEIKYLGFLYTIQVNSASAHNDWLVRK